MPREKPEVICDPLAEWRDRSACASPAAGMEDAWIADDDELKYRAARRVCIAECEVRYQCLLSALVDPEAEGVLGGYRFEGGGLATKDRTRLRNEYGYSARSIRKAGRAA